MALAAAPRASGRGRQPVAVEAEREHAIESLARHTEDREAWGRVIHLTGRGHLSVVADRPDLSLASFGEIRSIASRRLRQLNGGSDAA